jgi:NOL1/NOP2/sun family putative RNA methylase
MTSFVDRYKELKPSFDLNSCPNIEQVRDVLRVNTLKIDEIDLIKRLKKRGVKLKKLSWLPHAYKYKSKFSLASTNEYVQGYFYLQEAASQVPALVLDPKQDDLVLDMCAAPGSKTTYLSQLMNNSGKIIALDSNISRLAALKSNLLRCGCLNVLVYKKDARFAFDLNKKFDKVLLDAPCSGNFVIEDDFFTKRNIQSFFNRAKLQRELLKSAHKVLKSKGELVYSTCSLEPEENERVINWFIKTYDDMKLIDIDFKVPCASPGLTSAFDKTFSNDLKKTLRVWPDTSKLQGFFIAKLIKK